MSFVHFSIVSQLFYSLKKGSLYQGYLNLIIFVTHIFVQIVFAFELSL